MRRGNWKGDIAGRTIYLVLGREHNLSHEAPSACIGMRPGRFRHNSSWLAQGTVICYFRSHDHRGSLGSCTSFGNLSQGVVARKDRGGAPALREVPAACRKASGACPWLQPRTSTSCGTCTCSAPRAYYEDCQRLFGGILDHDGGFGQEPSELPILKATFEQTAALWEAEYGEPYFACGESTDATEKCWHDCQSRCWHACKNSAQIFSTEQASDASQ
jgi:hypothetical protein